MMIKYVEAESRSVELEEIMRIHLCIDLEFKCNEYSCQFFIDAVKIHQYLLIYHRDGFIAHIQRSRIFLCYCIPKLFQIGFMIKWFTLHFGYMYDISLLKEVLIFLQVWCLENLKVKGTLDMIAMTHWGNIHLVKSRHLCNSFSLRANPF